MGALSPASSSSSAASSSSAVAALHAASLPNNGIVGDWFCVHLLQHLRDWFPACLLPPNQRTTTRQPDLAHLASPVSLLLTLDHLRTIFRRFLSTKPNPQLTMNM